MRKWLFVAFISALFTISAMAQPGGRGGQRGSAGVDGRLLVTDSGSAILIGTTGERDGETINVTSSARAYDAAGDVAWETGFDNQIIGQALTSGGELVVVLREFTLQPDDSERTTNNRRGNRGPGANRPGDGSGFGGDGGVSTIVGLDVASGQTLWSIDFEGRVGIKAAGNGSYFVTYVAATESTIEAHLASLSGGSIAWDNVIGSREIPTEDGEDDGEEGGE